MEPDVNFTCSKWYQVEIGAADRVIKPGGYDCWRPARYDYVHISSDPHTYLNLWFIIMHIRLHTSSLCIIHSHMSWWELISALNSVKSYMHGCGCLGSFNRTEQDQLVSVLFVYFYILVLWTLINQNPIS